jgi:hypothetical protein
VGAAPPSGGGPVAELIKRVATACVVVLLISD